MGLTEVVGRLELFARYDKITKIDICWFAPKSDIEVKNLDFF